MWEHAKFVGVTSLTSKLFVHEYTRFGTFGATQYLVVHKPVDQFAHLSSLALASAQSVLAKAFSSFLAFLACSRR